MNAVHTIIAHSNNIYIYIPRILHRHPQLHTSKSLSLSILDNPTLNLKVSQETGNSANVVFLITSRQIQGH
jgi:hypothetical protein